MSGIGGIFQRDGRPVDALDLSAVLGRLSRRGPDASGIWREGPVGLAQTQLWSTPESLAEQLPLISSGGELVLVMDGRIDNRSELLPRLDDLRDRPDREVADSQIVLSAYRKWGADCLPLLVGDFAFAIWDASRARLFCARDVFGVRPFYYFCDHDRFAFGSEIKVLLALPFVSRDLNETAVADFMLQVFDDKAGTFYSAIRRLPPASCLLVTPTDLRIQQYWGMDGDREIRFKTGQEYGEAYRDLFVEAVRARLRSAYPTGSALSGGLDSSSVTTVSGRLLAQRGQTLDTFSVIFDDVPASDERSFMQIVLDQGSYRPHFVRGDTAQPVGYLGTFLQEQDQPFPSPNLFIDYEMWRSASQQGMRVFLEGLFGDNIVSHGSLWLNELARTWRWWELYRQLGFLSRTLENTNPILPVLWRYIYHDGIKANIPPSMLALYRRARGRPVNPLPAVSPILNPDYARRLDLSRRLQVVAGDERLANTTRKSHLRELNSSLIPNGLEIYSSGSATFSLDVRFPYMDRRLVEFCLAVPADQKLDKGYSRMVLRRGMEGYLPEQIRWRVTKGDLSHNLFYLLNNERGKLDELFSVSARYLQPYIDLAVLQKWTGRVYDRRATNEQVLSVYLSAVLACWFCNRDGVQNGAEGDGLLPRTNQPQLTH